MLTEPLAQALRETPAPVWEATSSALVGLADGTPVTLLPDVARLIAVLSDYALSVAETKE